jgi:hypothetical protein
MPGLLVSNTNSVGVESTTTLIVVTADIQPFNVTTTEYTPEFAVMAGLMDGFCDVDEKPLGPVHANVEPEAPEAVRLRVLPEHIGELLPNTGAGVGRISTVVVALLEHSPSVAVTVYVPLAVRGGLGRIGFCTPEV